MTPDERCQDIIKFVRDELPGPGGWKNVLNKMSYQGVALWMVRASNLDLDAIKITLLDLFRAAQEEAK